MSEQDATAVEQAVKNYVDGVKASDAQAVKDAFRDDAVMWGYLGPDVTVLPAAGFADQVVATAPPADENYTSTIHSIAITGDIATAILDERGYLGADFRNHFGLLRVDGEWKIASKVFTTVASA
ncbi:MAG TPA: nuclear transport factor 2 family protein [Microbacterium sp.]|nr:nuclear transport factor 2 family protein [Microbacterium sp.]